MEGLDSAAFGSFIRSLLSPDYIKEQVTTLVDTVFDYLEGSTIYCSLNLILRRLKLNSPVQTKINYCTTGKCLTGLSGEQSANNSLPLCNQNSLMKMSLWNNT